LETKNVFNREHLNFEPGNEYQSGPIKPHRIWRAGTGAKLPKNGKAGREGDWFEAEMVVEMRHFSLDATLFQREVSHLLIKQFKEL
jgi:hypothetical protein